MYMYLILACTVYNLHIHCTCTMHCSCFIMINSFISSHSTLRTPLHHRRTFSDTAFINKLFSQKENKPGPSSSGNSPSSTPAFFPPSPPSLSASSSTNVINQSSTTPDVVSTHSCTYNVLQFL